MVFGRGSGSIFDRVFREVFGFVVSSRGEESRGWVFWGWVLFGVWFFFRRVVISFVCSRGLVFGRVLGDLVIKRSICVKFSLFYGFWWVVGLGCSG